MTDPTTNYKIVVALYPTILAGYEAKSAGAYSAAAKTLKELIDIRASISYMEQLLTMLVDEVDDISAADISRIYRDDIKRLNGIANDWADVLEAAIVVASQWESAARRLKAITGYR